MNYALRNIVLVLVVIFLLSFGAYYLFLRQEGQYIPDNWADMDCISPISVATDNLQPTIKKGVILLLNQCIKNRESLSVGTIVKFETEGRDRLGIIEEIEIEERKTSYIISTSYFDENNYTVPSEQIIAYTKILE